MHLTVSFFHLYFALFRAFLHDVFTLCAFYMGCLHGVAWCVHMHCIWCVDVYSQGICPHQFTGILFFTARVFHVMCYTFCALHMIYKHWVFHMYLPLVFMYTEYFICIYGLCSCVLPDVSTHILCIVHDVFTCAVYDVVTHTICDLPIGCLQCVVCSLHMYCVWDVHMINHVWSVYMHSILCVHMCSAWFVYMYSVFASCTVYDAFIYTVYGVFTWCTMYGVFPCTFTYIVYGVFTCSVSCLHVKCVIYSHV